MKHLLIDLWARWQAIAAPVPLVPLATVTPLAPMAQDEFADTHAQAALEALQDHAHVERVIRENNAYVYRDYGRGRVVLKDGDSKDVGVPPDFSLFVPSSLVPRCDP